MDSPDRGRCSPGAGGRPLWRNQGGGGPPRSEWRRHPCRRGTFVTRASRPRRGGRRIEWRSRPVSRVLSWTVIPLGASSPIRSSNLPGPDAGRVMRSLFGLAPGGVCRAGLLPGSRCALTAPFHPCHASRRTVRRYLSVALSVGSRRPGVTWHRALWSPDFPRHPAPRRVPDDATVWPAPPRALSHAMPPSPATRGRCAEAADRVRPCD